MLENVYEGLNARKCKGRSNQNFQSLVSNGRSNKKSSKNKVHLFPNSASGRTLPTRVSQKNTFVVYNFGGRITGAYGCPEPPKKISEL